MNSTRWPASISAWPMPQPSGSCRRRAGRRAGRWRPGRASSSPSASAMTWALDTLGTAAKSKLARRLVRASAADSARWRSMRRVSRSAISCSSSASSKRSAGQPSRSDCAPDRGHSRLIVGRRSSVSISGTRRRSACRGGGAAHALHLQQRVVAPPARASPPCTSGSSPWRGANCSRSASQVGQLIELDAARRAAGQLAPHVPSAASSSRPTMVWQASRSRQPARSSCSQVWRYALRGNSASRSTQRAKRRACA